MKRGIKNVKKFLFVFFYLEKRKNVWSVGLKTTRSISFVVLHAISKAIILYFYQQ